MRILFITPYVPSQVRIRPFAFIRELARMGYEVTLVCLVQPDQEARYIAEVKPYCKAVYPVFLNRFEPYIRSLASLPTGTPLSVAYCRSDQLNQIVRHLNEQEDFDLIHTEFLRAAPATAHLQGRPKVFAAVDSLALAYRRSLTAAHVPPKQRALALIEWLKIRRYEPSLIGHYDHLLVSSPADQQAMGAGSDRVMVLPNGVYLDYFQYNDGERDPETIMFLGKMSYYVNVASVLWFYHRVLPLIRRHNPRVKFQIVGRDPAPKIRALAQDPQVEVTGTVPDVRPYLSRATVTVCPMVSGAGIQNKMLESMAVGTPCVSTSLAFQALCAEAGRDVLLGDTEEAFASAVLELLNSPERRRNMSVNGRKYVESFHAWDRIGERLAGVYKSLNGWT
ncbi:MAG: glycosyltransferase [Chloroflexi bacterium]|nr:glycosyltransferase [Chloroflexota bacterium]